MPSTSAMSQISVLFASLKLVPLAEAFIPECVLFSVVNGHTINKFSNTYRRRFLTYLTQWRRFFILATTPSNQQNLLLTMAQALYLLEVFILAHYGPQSIETPTTETTIVQCHKNSWIYLTSTYYWWLLKPTITIRFHSKFQIIAQLFDSIRFEMKKNTIRTSLIHRYIFADIHNFSWMRMFNFCMIIWIRMRTVCGGR